MKKIFLSLTVLCALAGLTIGGCAQKPAASSGDAITQSKTLQTVQEQVKYLIGQANAFINSQKFDEAINTAQYVLSNLDSNSTEAKSIITKAQEQIKQMAGKAMEDMKNKLGTLGK